MLRKWSVLSVLLILAIVLAACASSEAGYEVSEEMSYLYAGDTDMAFAPSAPMAAREFDEAAMSISSGVSANAVQRIVIKNASLSISVEDVEDVMQKTVRLADTFGGFVVSSNMYRRTLSTGAELPQAEVSLRVPADRFVEALDTISGYSVEVLSRNESGEDVTQQYTDLQSRLRNLESAEAALQGIMEKAEDTEDVLNVFNQLTQVRGEIEVIKGQIKYYEESAAFSLISVTIIADEAVQPLTIAGWEPAGVAKEAVQSLLDTLQFIADTLIWLVIYLVPVALVLFFLLLLPVRWLFRWLRSLWKRIGAKKVAPPAPPASQESAAE